MHVNPDLTVIPDKAEAWIAHKADVTDITTMYPDAPDDDLEALGWSLVGLVDAARVPALLLVALLSLFWVFIPSDPASGHNLWNWPPAFFSWFAAGMVLAELTVMPVGWAHRLARRRFVMAGIAVVAFAVAASPLAGREGLQPGSIGQVMLKTAMGAIVAGALLAPVITMPPLRSGRAGSA